jgi:hypothetical protein
MENLLMPIRPEPEQEEGERSMSAELVYARVRRAGQWRIEGSQARKAGLSRTQRG